MLVAAAVCPHPPLLVPEVAGAAAPELDALRAACDEAIRRLPLPVSAPGPATPGGIMQWLPAELLVVVGADEATRTYSPDAAGSLRPYGLDLTVGPGEPVLPLSLTIGRWLLGRAIGPVIGPVIGPAIGSGRVRVRFQGVAERAAPAECLRLGGELAGAAERVAMLVLGDGSACRADKASGDLDERAEPYDAAVAKALGAADAAAVAALDPELSGELQVAGRAAWQVLAGAAGAAEPAPGRGRRPAQGASDFAGAVLADVAPYGVGYFVASWLRRRPEPALPQP